MGKLFRLFQPIFHGSNEILTELGRCSVDPYLFENFNTVDGDFLTAKFRAFKFPDTTFVQFRGTVNVCVDKCKGIQCSNGQIGYGRRRREISPSADGNKVFEISMTTFIRVDGDPAHVNKSKLRNAEYAMDKYTNVGCMVFAATIEELEQKLSQLKLANQKLERNSRGSVFESVHDNKAYIQRASPNGDAIIEETTLIRSKSTTPNAATNHISGANVFVILPVSIVLVATLFLRWKIPNLKMRMNEWMDAWVCE